MRKNLMRLLFLCELLGFSSLCFGSEIPTIAIKEEYMVKIHYHSKDGVDDECTLRTFYSNEHGVVDAFILDKSKRKIARLINYQQSLRGPSRVGTSAEGFEIGPYGDLYYYVIAAQNGETFKIRTIENTLQREELLPLPAAELDKLGEKMIFNIKSNSSRYTICDPETVKSINNALSEKKPLHITFLKNKKDKAGIICKVLEYRNDVVKRILEARTRLDGRYEAIKIDIDLDVNEKYIRDQLLRKVLYSTASVVALSLIFYCFRDKFYSLMCHINEKYA